MDAVATHLHDRLNDGGDLADHVAAEDRWMHIGHDDDDDDAKIAAFFIWKPLPLPEALENAISAFLGAACFRSSTMPLPLDEQYD